MEIRVSRILGLLYNVVLHPLGIIIVMVFMSAIVGVFLSDLAQATIDNPQVYSIGGQSIAKHMIELSNQIYLKSTVLALLSLIPCIVLGPLFFVMYLLTSIANTDVGKKKLHQDTYYEVTKRITHVENSVLILFLMLVIWVTAIMSSWHTLLLSPISGLMLLAVVFGIITIVPLVSIFRSTWDVLKLVKFSFILDDFKCCIPKIKW